MLVWWIYCCWTALSWAELSLIILYFILMAESFHNRMSKIFSYISEDEDKKIVLFEKRLHSYLYKILVNTVKGTLMMWAAWREKSSQGRKNIQSPHCEETFSKQAGLHYHIQVNHPDEVRKEQAPAFVSLRQTAILCLLLWGSEEGGRSCAQPWRAFAEKFGIGKRWGNNSVFEYYSNTWGQILVFIFVFGWSFETE